MLITAVIYNSKYYALTISEFYKIENKSFAEK